MKCRECLVDVPTPDLKGKLRSPAFIAGVFVPNIECHGCAYQITPSRECNKRIGHLSRSATFWGDSGELIVKEKLWVGSKFFQHTISKP